MTPPCDNCALALKRLWGMRQPTPYAGALPQTSWEWECPGCGVVWRGKLPFKEVDRGPRIASPPPPTKAKRGPTEKGAPMSRPVFEISQADGTWKPATLKEAKRRVLSFPDGGEAMEVADPGQRHRGLGRIPLPDDVWRDVQHSRLRGGPEGGGTPVL